MLLAPICFLLLSHLSARITAAELLSPSQQAEVDVLLALAPLIGLEARWNTSMWHCSWDGLTCNADGFISELSLASREIVVDLSVFEPLQQLGSLELMDLSHNSISGDLVASFNRMPNIQYMYLGFNRITGPLPPQWGNMTSLKELGLQQNELTGVLPEEWGGLLSLRKLFVGAGDVGDYTTDWWGTPACSNTNSLSGDLPFSFSRLTNLTALYLDCNHFQGPLLPAWSSLANLKHFYLNNNDIVSILPQEWAHWTSLEQMDVSYNAIEGALPLSYNKLTSIKKFKARDCKLSGT
jgi:Leucine-rich repeat (LRR) protein